MNQKDLDLEVANRLEQFADNLSQSSDISEGRMSYVQYCNTLYDLRYAISVLRGE